MKVKLYALTGVLLLTGCSKEYKAVHSLKALDAKAKAGVSREEFANAVDAAAYDVQQFEDAKDPNRNEGNRFARDIQTSLDEFTRSSSFRYNCRGEDAADCKSDVNYWERRAKEDLDKAIAEE